MKCACAIKSFVSGRRGLAARMAALLLLMPLLAPAEELPSLFPEGSVINEGGGPLEVQVSDGSIVYLVTFEGGGQFTQIHPETGGLVPGTPIRFSLDSCWLTMTSGPFANNPSVPTIALYVARTTADVTFEEPVSHVSMFYASAVPVVLQAFDTSGAVVDSMNGAVNYSGGWNQWDLIEVSGNGENVITRVRIHGSPGATAIDDFSCTVETDLEVEIDLKPENADNAVDPFNLNSNKPVEVAVFSTADFDATTIDLTTVELGDPLLEPAVPALGAVVGDLNGDELPDVIFDFGYARNLGDAGALDEFSTEVLLTGWTPNVDIFGFDDVVIAGGGP